MAEARFAMLEDRGVLAVSGPDRRPFLQGLVTNDVDKVTPRAARYAALLTAQGKYLHDFIITEADESILLDAEADRLADLKRRLSLYRLRAKASLEERPDLCAAAVFGDGALEALDLPPETGACRPYNSGLAFVDPRLTALGARAILRRETAKAVLLDSGLAQTGVDAYDRLRLSLGVPDGSRDLIGHVAGGSVLLEQRGTFRWTQRAGMAQRGCEVRDGFAMRPGEHRARSGLRGVLQHRRHVLCMRGVVNELR